MIQNKTEYIIKLKHNKTNLGILPRFFTMEGEYFNTLVNNQIKDLEEFNNEIEQLKGENKELQNKILELETKAKIVPRVVYRKR